MDKNLNRGLQCKDCLHCNYSYCKETEDDFYIIRADNQACEDFAPKNPCINCVYCYKENKVYKCKFGFKKHSCKLFKKAKKSARNDNSVAPRESM